VDYLDILLLHRPDILMETEEIAEAFQLLKAAGKVRYLGVSNMSAAQMRFVQQALPEPLVVNQLEMSLARLDWAEQGILVNQKAGLEVNFADGIMEYCQMENVQIQAWGPLAQGIFSGKSAEKATEAQIKTTELVQLMAMQKGTTPEAIILAWLMKHPALIQPVIGTANAERILACKDAVEQSQLLSREEWYALFTSSRGKKMP
jgi:predicted oxidoreductase